MSNLIFVRPKAGLLVPDPATKDFLPEEGRSVESSIYWKRRIADGDVTIDPQGPLKSTVKPSKKDA